MFTLEPEKEPDEYVRKMHLQAVSEHMITNLSENYDSGTDAPPAKVIETHALPVAQSVVPGGIIAEFIANLSRYSDELRGDIRLYHRTKENAHVLGTPAPIPAAAQSKAAKSPRRARTAKK